MMNKENNKLRGNANARKMQFHRRRKPLNIDPNAQMSNFFGTVGSPIKMSTFEVKKRTSKDEVNPNIVGIGAVGAPAAAGGAAAANQRKPAPSFNSEVATLDLRQKLALQEEIRKQQRQEQLKAQADADAKKKYDAAVKAAEEAAAARKAAAAQPAPAPATPAAADASDVETVKNDGNRGRRDRRNSTEFLGAPMEPVQQLKLDGAKKAKIPHFMSAWFNIGGNDAKEAAAAPTPAATPAAAPAAAPAPKEADAAPAAPAPAKQDAAAAPAQNATTPRNSGMNTRSAISQSIDFSEITVGRMIGEGAFGKVHEGKWRGKAVAIKLLICQDLRTDILNEFQSEVEIMSVLRHPNICRLLGACMEPPNRALVVELLQRGSLWGVLRTNRKSIDLEMRTRFIYDTAKGMSYLHHFERPILHRDLKSPNLLVDKNYNTKLSDFGLARVKAHVQTMTGNCGTVQWMAPEVLGNQKYTEKADVFSFGIVIWEIVTGECPYDGMSQIQAALGVLNRNLRPNIPRDCPPFFSRLMKACWNRQPELRPSFPHIVNAFRAYQASISESRATPSAVKAAKAAVSASIAAN
jgi:hypothetical protein